jgi:HrpA-like RNA helicase
MLKTREKLDELLVEEEVDHKNHKNAFPEKLPIDEHKDEIVEHIFHHRVTIIHGETGIICNLY